MTRHAVLAFILFVLSVSAARAEFYKWVDRDGREFYTNDKEKIPAEYRNTARSVEVHDERVSVGQSPVVDGTKPVKVREHKDKYGRGEEYWHKRAADLRRQIRNHEDEYDALLKQEQRDESGQKKPSSGKKKKSRSSRGAKKDKLEKKIARLKQELDVELPDEARKADAYPGWLRE